MKSPLHVSGYNHPLFGVGHIHHYRALWATSRHAAHYGPYGCMLNLILHHLVPKKKFSIITACNPYACMSDMNTYLLHKMPNCQYYSLNRIRNAIMTVLILGNELKYEDQAFKLRFDRSILLLSKNKHIPFVFHVTTRLLNDNNY